MLVALAILLLWISGNLLLIAGLYLHSGAVAELRAVNRFGDRRAQVRVIAVDD
jgi:hypothetical protein